ncbi:MAG: HPr family phosphocarrier protein [Ruminiclostridium sp.]|nr:HPr family phosphocarrier protein [Ruminiclostridium sp.]
MMRFEHTIHNPTGIHGRPAWKIFKLARRFADTTITITKGDKSARANALLRLMLLGAGLGDTVTITIEGIDEMAASIAMQNFFWNNL